MSIFRQSLPILAPAFINRCGTIGLSLLPMLLVEKQLSAGRSSVVMTIVRVALLGGTFLGGWVCDRLGRKAALLLSFLLAGVGLAALPFGSSMAWICVWAALGQLGQAIFYSPARVMIIELVPPESQQESIGWLKTANNLGNIFSYLVGAIFSVWGVAALMLFDAVTSLAAAAVGAKLMRAPSTRATATTKKDESHDGSWAVFIVATLTVAGFYGLFDMFTVSAAAKCRLLFGDGGLRLFSEAMVINVALCTVFAVYAARHLRNPSIMFPLGIVLVAAGTALIAAGSAKALVFLAVFVITVGEILFAALAQFVIMRSQPKTKHQGSIYGASLAVQSLGRIGGAAAAFPMVVHHAHPLPFLGATTAVVLALSVTLSILVRPRRSSAAQSVRIGAPAMKALTSSTASR